MARVCSFLILLRWHRTLLEQCIPTLPSYQLLETTILFDAFMEMLCLNLKDLLLKKQCNPLQRTTFWCDYTYGRSSSASERLFVLLNLSSEEQICWQTQVNVQCLFHCGMDLLLNGLLSVIKTLKVNFILNI